MSSMYVFTKVGSPICHVLLTVQNTHRRALLFIDNRQLFLHKQNWAASTDINFIVTYWALIKHQALLTIQAKLKLAIILFYISVKIDSGEIVASVCQEKGNFEVLKRCYIQK